MTENNVIPFSPSTPPNQPQSKKKTIPGILKDNNSANDRIKLRARKLSNGLYSLYLDLRRDGRKEYQFLKIYVKDVKVDREKIEYAVELRNSKQNDLIQNEHEFRLKNDLMNINFTEYFQYLALNRTRPDKSWRNTLLHLKIFTKDKTVTFKMIDTRFCENFKNYLLDNLGSRNTVHVYFAKLKAALNHAIKDDILSKNPAQFIHVSKQDTDRAFLTLDELKKLAITPCPDEQTKRAFIFGCYTGLRISDIFNLSFDQIQNEHIVFRQIKTRGFERIKLSWNALQIISDQIADGITDGKIFHLCTPKHALNHLKKWAKKAGINKNITWHSARHTCATLAITHGTDIYTVSKILGHREIRTTQIYAKLLDEKKDEAIDNLPRI